MGEGGKDNCYRLSDGGFGGKYRLFSFHNEDGDGLCASHGLGDLPNFEIKNFQYLLSNA